MSMEECTRRTSIDLDQRGYFVVEEISEDDDVTDGGRISSMTATTTSASSSTPPPGSPAAAEGTDNKLNNESPLLLSSTTFKPSYNPLRREFGNISPISEDFSESDKEMDGNGRILKDISLLGGGGGEGSEEDELDNTRTSTTAVAGDNTSLLLQRLNCSSPILAQSPSLRKTPIVAAAMEETAAEESVSSESPSHSGGKGKKMRNFARALDDISDRDEDDEDNDVILMGSKDSDDDDMMDEGCSFEASEEVTGQVSDDEEKTESFEIDLNNSAERQSEGGCSPFSLKTSDSYVEFGTAVANLEKLKLSQKQEADANSIINKEQQERQRTVWETLSDNIETHINGGNNAGFVSGPIDHPIHVTKSPEPTEHLVMSLEELELIDRYDEEHKILDSSAS